MGDLQAKLPADLKDAVINAGYQLSGNSETGIRLAGGVSSDIWKIDTESGPVCIKRALPKLKVEQDWFAPTERNAFEARWMRTVSSILPHATVPVLHENKKMGFFIMPFLDPADHPVWKSKLSLGDIDPSIARVVGHRLGVIHAATYQNKSVHTQFQTDDIFHMIRLEPYLLATSERHPSLAPRLEELSEITASTNVCLVHGDVSPKNILVGRDGPLFIDAECAWYGDPAFDVAFCLNHLLLKAFLAPMHRDALHQSFQALTASYSNAVFETMDADDVMSRAAALLPGLFLARVDGKSPVEYIRNEVDKDRVRRTAAQYILDPPSHPDDLSAAWHLENR